MSEPDTPRLICSTTVGGTECGCPEPWRAKWESFDPDAVAALVAAYQGMDEIAARDLLLDISDEWELVRKQPKPATH